MNYYLDVIRNKLQGAIGDRIKYFYIGDPLYLPAEVLEKGCVLISPNSQSSQLQDTQMDSDEYVVSITVLKDMRQEYNKKPQEVVSTAWLMDIIDGRDGNGALKQNTIRSIMRKSLTEIGLTHTFSVEYGTSQRDEVLARAAVVTIRLSDIVARAR